MADPTLDDIDKAIAVKSKPSMDDINNAIAIKSQKINSVDDEADPTSNASAEQNSLFSIIKRIRSGKADLNDPGEALANHLYTHPGETGAMIASAVFPPAELVGPLASGAKAAQILSRAGRIGGAAAGIAAGGAATGQATSDLAQGKSIGETASNAADQAIQQGVMFGGPTAMFSAAAPYFSKVGNAMLETDTGKATADAIKAASKRLGFSPTPGMLSNSPVVQGLESSLSQSPSIPGAMVKHSIKPVAQGLQKAAEDLVSGAPPTETSAYNAGNDAVNGVLSKVGEQVSNIKMAYEPFNQELPKMVPDKLSQHELADKIYDISQQHLDPNEVNSLTTGLTNKIMNSKNLADIEDTRKLIGNKISQAYSNNDTNLADTLTKMKDKLSSYRDEQFQILAKQAYPGPGGAAIGKQMVEEYKAAMASHHALMNDLREVGPLFGIRASNPRDFVEAFSEMPPEQVAKKLFSTNNVSALQKVQHYFPEEFNTIKGLKLQELRNSSLANPIDPSNSPVDPSKLVAKINKMTPEVRAVLFGDKAQKLKDMQIVIGSFPEHIGPSGTPKGEAFAHWADPTQQAGDFVRYMGYKALGSQAAKVIPEVLPKIAETAPNVAGPIASVLTPDFVRKVETALPAAAQESSPKNKQSRSPTSGYSEGGTVQNTSIPLPNIDQQKIQAAQASMRKAFGVKGYSDGGTVRPAPAPLPNIDPQKILDAQASMRKAFGVKGFSEGGVIPGTPQTPVNSPQNDNTLIKVTPGEVVLPLSVTQSPNAPQRAKEFMANEMLKNKGSHKVEVDELKGPQKWANDGFQTLSQHVNDEDRALLEEHKGKFMLNPKATNLLVSASSFKPGSKPLDDILGHLKVILENHKGSK